MKATNEIHHNTFTGVQWDATSIEAIQTIATALLNLTEVFRSQHIQIEMLKIVNDKIEQDDRRTT